METAECWAELVLSHFGAFFLLTLQHAFYILEETALLKRDVAVVFITVEHLKVKEKA